MQKKSSLLLVSAWVVALIGFILGLAFEPHWFARFGSLVVLLSLMTEYILLHAELNRLYAGLAKVDSDTDIPDLSPSKWHKKKVWVAHFTVVLGTFIWGFGDLVF
ncbi:hypothetical protein THMIRHAM_15420 [Thiomicrorhabdus immobilis]|uniref:Uncharacterized protein n=1 Tax=Thiomicrorhabdus immobilis TaxID=2791037 RepID=A0ABN6CX95_9GAMM|nr:hypothetical protein [Thiomicrorhabdus immobilis]BCN93757.1 hypothetical protein THMIRHAM_15420 [Thiomicrorhabdus immobilis]